MADATVKFNVGGKHFEVSRALVDGSDTVLGRLVSETWNGDPNEAVFVDRDGDLFAHILNYLRYGSIELPITVPRSMFDRELDYYGIAPAGDRVTDQGGLAEISDSFAKGFQKAKKKHDSFFLAAECYSQFLGVKLGSPTKNDVVVVIPEDHKLSGGSFDTTLFHHYLERYFGLMCPPSNYPNLQGESFRVSLKK